MSGFRSWQSQLLAIVLGVMGGAQVGLHLEVHRLKATDKDQYQLIQNIREQYELTAELIQAQQNEALEAQRQATAAAEREANRAREKAAAGENAGTGYFEPLTLPAGSPTTAPLLGPAE